jgi:hypothetical protein
VANTIPPATKSFYAKNTRPLAATREWATQEAAPIIISGEFPVKRRRNQLTEEERQRLRSSERWRTSLQQLLAAIRRLAGNTGSALASLQPPMPAPDRPEGSNRSGKRWVRPEPATQATTPETTNTETTKPADTGAAESSGQDG